MEAERSLDQEVHQRHHDRYVWKERTGRLTEADLPQYELAMEREQAGIVTPTPEDYQPEDRE